MIYWLWLFPQEQDPIIPTDSPSWKEYCTILLFSSIKGQTEEARTETPCPPGWKPQSQKTNKKWAHAPQICITYWNCESSCAGPPKVDKPWLRFLTKCGQLEKEMTNHCFILALRTPLTEWKGKKIWNWKMRFQVSRYPISYWGRAEKYL